MSQILVVDDDRIPRTLMTKVLENAGYSCFSASSAEEALDIFKGQHISLIVTDLRMPGIDGIQLFKQARSLRPNIRGILCSAYVSYDVISDIMESGLDDCLMKPVSGDKLIATVERSLDIQLHWRLRVAELRNIHASESADEPLTKNAEAP